MKNPGIIFLILSLCICCDSKREGSLFQITENGKTGFINSAGQVVIKPTFLTAGEFSEGLANARINGTYGYIDKTGNFAIQPQFDYASPFSEGQAVVYKEGRPFVINKNGQKAFDCNFPAIGKFLNGKAVVKTAMKKFGAIDKQGKLFIDTAYTRINPFVKGLAVVEGLNHHAYDEKEKGITRNFEVGVIDSLGKFVIPYGKFMEIGDFDDGYFKAEIPAEAWDTVEGYTARTAIVDITGKIIISKDQKNNSYLNGNPHCGLVKMNLYKYWIPEKEGVYSTTNKSYAGFMNLNGEVSINDTTYTTVEDFADDRAFVRGEDDNYSLINTKGEVIAKKAFDKIIEPGFKNGYAFVAVDGKWGMIDTNGNFIIKPQFDGIDGLGLIDDYFFFNQNHATEQNEYDKLTGIAKKDGSIILKPVIQQFDAGGFHNGLLKCIVEGKLTYIDKSGKTVWQDAGNESKQLTNLNIDFMNRGYFYAGSAENEHDLGGFAGSENWPNKISSSNNFPPDDLSLIVRQENKDTIFGNRNGLTVFVANNSKTKREFNAQDGRLYMKVQALDTKGEWKDIEYLPSSWCGNSYHTLTLEPKFFWTLMTPVYDGDFKTKLRIELKCFDPNDKTIGRRNKKEIIIYSNEFEGHVNPGQFWRKLEYFPRGIMDPYFD